MDRRVVDTRLATLEATGPRSMMIRVKEGVVWIPQASLK